MLIRLLHQTATHQTLQVVQTVKTLATVQIEFEPVSLLMLSAENKEIMAAGDPMQAFD